MMTFDDRRISSARLNHIRINGTLHQVIYPSNLFGLFFKYTDKFLANEFAFFLRFGYTGQFRQKTIFCIYPDKIHAFIRKSRFHFVSFVFAHKTMIHKNTGQLRTHRFR